MRVQSPFRWTTQMVRLSSPGKMPIFVPLLDLLNKQLWAVVADIADVFVGFVGFHLICGKRPQ